jgi:sugar phosphate isomerase/epimerase
MADEPARRLEYLRRAVRVGADLGAEAVSFWSGIAPPTPPSSTNPPGAGAPSRAEHEPAGARCVSVSRARTAGDGGSAWDRLVRGCSEIVEVAAAAGVTLGFEPEPGMLVADIADWRRLHADLGLPAGFGITLDIGHCRCLEPLPVPACVADVADTLVNVQIDDMRRRVHEHLEFGQGEIDFPPVLAALDDAGYRGLVSVELPRHVHAAPEVAARSIDFLRKAAP